MFCTKCGANLPQGAARCPSCGAQPRFHPQASPPARAPARRSYSKPALIALGAVAVLVAGGIGIDRLVTSRPIAGPQLTESAHAPAAPAASGALSGADLMFLPKANLSFVGDWGGHLQVQGSASAVAAAKFKSVPASFFFGQQNGEVYLTTNLYGNPKWKVVKTRVKVIDPQNIEFSVDSLCQSCTPPQREQQVTRLTLVNSSELQAKVYSYSAAGGGAQGELSYSGTLHPLTTTELDAIDREVRRDGKFMAKVNSEVPASN